jgi:hypothetical protein
MSAPVVGFVDFCVACGKGMTPGAQLHPIVRWFALLWIAVWLPVNVYAWGWQNMMHFCDVGAIIACIGVWKQDSLFVSSQAVGALFVGLLWSLDIGWRLVIGRHLFGGTEYMWDSHYALWIRLMSLFHIWLPLLLLWAMRKLGYDRRALAFQSALAGGLLVFSRYLPPSLNMNYAFEDPLLHRAWGPVPLHLAVILAGTILVLYWPTHLLLRWMYAVPIPAKGLN